MIRRLLLIGVCFLLIQAAVCPQVVGVPSATPPDTSPIPSLYDEPDIFLKAIEGTSQIPSAPRHISGLTVPHHLLAVDLIARGFSRVDFSRTDKIVILFPDHFKRTWHPFATTSRDFQTVLGPVRTSKSDTHFLLRFSELVQDSDLFAKDHGIEAILPFVAHYAPNAEIIPIAVSGRSRRRHWDELARHLARIVTPQTLVIQSTDFSHYLPLGEAVQRDQMTLDAIATGDPEALAALHQPKNTDAVGAQYIQSRLQQNLFHAQPIVLFNKNSQAYSDETEPRTTSYMVVIYSSRFRSEVGRDEEGSKVYCFAGDLLLGRNVATALANQAVSRKLLDSMTHTLNGCRLIVNLEGVAMREVPGNLPKMRLGMPAPLVLDWLRDLNVVATGVANNHSMDFGQSGLDETTRILDAAGRHPLPQGVPVDLGPFRVEAFTDLENYRSEASSQLKESQVKEAVAKARPPVIAFMHWGKQFDPHPSDRQRLIAQWLKEAGVVFVVGAHPHVANDVLELTEHASPPVAYSLGNFLFDESSKMASGAVVELRVFDQGTFFARVIPIPTYFDLIRRSGPRKSPE